RLRPLHRAHAGPEPVRGRPRPAPAAREGRHPGFRPGHRAPRRQELRPHRTGLQGRRHAEVALRPRRAVRPLRHRLAFVLALDQRHRLDWEARVGVDQRRHARNPVSRSAAPREGPGPAPSAEAEALGPAGDRQGLADPARGAGRRDAVSRQTGRKRALLSVFDKTGVVDLGRELAALGYTLLSTGGTAAALKSAGVPVVEIGHYTGQPEILEGRVKTLHPKVHGGILADLSKESHRADLTRSGIEPIALVVVNLYPFREVAARPGARLEEIIEMIDVGGPAMVRAAAKNHRHVGVV